MSDHEGQRGHRIHRFQKMLHKLWLWLDPQFRRSGATQLHLRRSEQGQVVHHFNRCHKVPQSKLRGGVLSAPHQKGNNEGLHWVLSEWLRGQQDSHWQLGMWGFQWQCSAQVHHTVDCLLSCKQGNHLCALWIPGTHP